MGQCPTEVLNVAGLQKRDPEIAVVLKHMERGVQPSKRPVRQESWLVKRLLNQMSKLEIDAGVLYRRKFTEGGVVRQIILPKACRREVFCQLHDNM